MNGDMTRKEEINELRKEVEDLYNCGVNLFNIIVENGIKEPEKEKALLLKTLKKLRL
jgi:hypothetical protein